MAVQEVGGLLGLGVLGGLWAVAWGLRRGARDRSAMLDARTQFQVNLDAVRARTAALSRRDLPQEARGLIDQVVEQQVLVDAVLSRASSPADIDELIPELDDALASLERAAELTGLHMPAADPFDGLCQIDPAHGLAAATVADGDGAWRVCETCARTSESGRLPARRHVTHEGRPVPFEAATASRE
jgi:hypothetical protein